MTNLISDTKSPKEKAQFYSQIHSYGFLLKKVKGRVRNILNRNKGVYLSRRIKSPQPRRKSLINNEILVCENDYSKHPLTKLLLKRLNNS